MRMTWRWPCQKRSIELVSKWEMRRKMGEEEKIEKRGEMGEEEKVGDEEKIG